MALIQHSPFDRIRRGGSREPDQAAADPGPVSWPVYDVVVGASSGLGAALAAHLMSRGRPVVLAARRLERLNALAGAHGSGSPSAPICVQTDLRNPDQVAVLAETIQQTRRPVGTLFLVAGANEPAVTDDLRQRYRDLTEYMGLALVGWISLVESLEHGGGLTQESVVAGVSSIASAVPFSGLPVYGAGKAGFEQWLRATRHPDRARRVVVRPGRFPSEFFPTPGSPPLLPRVLAAQICAEVAGGHDEITLGGRGDRMASALHRGARVLGQRLVTDARSDRSDV